MKIELMVEKPTGELEYLESLELPFVPQIGWTFLNNRGVFVVKQVIFNQNMLVFIVDNVNDKKGYLEQLALN